MISALLLGFIGCQSVQTLGPGVVASRFQTAGLGCVVQVTPREKPDLHYRDYWLDERGRFMAFTSLPGDDDNKVTGTRTYFLFPRKQPLSFSLDGDLTLRLPTGDSMVFDGANARVLGFPGEFFEDNTVTLENQGGFEIRSFRGIRLDTGWKLGGQAYKNPAGSSVFSDSHNTQCTIRNDEFFFYENMYYGEPNLRFPDDPSLAMFLASRCPALDLTPLR